MNKSFCAVPVLGAALTLPATAMAIEVAGPALEIYGKLELSIDFSDTDKAGDSTNTSLSSNTTRLGFKGRHDIDPTLALVWQLEQEIRPDEADGKFATRNSYAGLSGNFGTVLFGHHDTPFKEVGSRWGVLGDTVGERRAILGAGALANNVMNQRGRNAILYKNTVRDVELQVMYATDAQDSAPGDVDNNDKDMFSIGAWYTLGALELSAAYEDWSDLSGLGATDGLRLAANHKLGPGGRVGAIIETTNSDTPDMDRTVFGVNGSYRMGSYTYEAQLLIADDYQGQADSGAWKLGLGVFNRLDAQTQVYAAFAVTDNDANARFKAVDGGHGDEVGTDLGGTPTALSAGLIYKF